MENNLSLFFNDLKNIDKMPDAFLIDYIKKAQNGDIESRNKVIESNIGLVIHCCKYYNGLNSLSFEDLINEGCFGLIEAINRYDDTKSVKFSTYAFILIRQSISKAILNKDNLIKIPYDINNKVQKIMKGISFILDNGYHFSIDLLSDIIDMDHDELTYFLIKYSYLFPSLFDTDIDLYDVIDDFDLENSVIDSFLPNYLNKAFDCLNYMEKEIIMMRFGFNCDRMSIDRIVKKYGYGTDKNIIIKREKKALKKLKEYSEKNSFKEYLRK